MINAEIVKKNLRENIKKYRKRNHLTQEKLSEMLDVTRATVSYWESGRNLPEIGTIVLICEIFHVTIENLCGLDESLNIIDEEEEKLRWCYRMLNEEGKRKLFERSEELKELGYEEKMAYRKKA